MKLEKIEKWPDHLYEHNLTDDQIAVAKASGQLDLLKGMSVALNQLRHLLEHNRTLYNLVVDHDNELTAWKESQGANKQVFAFLKLMFGASGWAVVGWQLFHK